MKILVAATAGVSMVVGAVLGSLALAHGWSPAAVARGDGILTSAPTAIREPTNSTPEKIIKEGGVEEKLEAAPPSGPRRGRWRRARIDGVYAKAGPEEVDEASQARSERLMALGYVSGSAVAGPRVGVTVRDFGAAETGKINLLTSGHEAGAHLIDMEGKVLHRWSIAFTDAWPEPLDFPVGEAARGYFRRVHLFPNGDLLGIFEGIGMAKLDLDSNVLWTSLERQHHDLEVAPDGSIFTLARAPLESHPYFPLEGPILEDFILILSPKGTVERRISILEAFLRSEYAAFLSTAGREGDIFHTNTLELLDWRAARAHPAFEAGHLLVSLRELNTIAVIDPEDGVVVWMLTGLWRGQHQPTMLENGNLLLFDNQGLLGTQSRVLEIVPLTQEVVWSYEGSGESRFFSETCGSSARLDNGNTLITETDNGRAFEVTASGDIVWEYVSPFRPSEDPSLVASLFEVIRIDPSQLQFLGTAANAGEIR